MVLGHMIKDAIFKIAPPTEPDQSFGQALTANFVPNPGPPELPVSPEPGPPDINDTFIGDAFSQSVLALAHPQHDFLL